MALNYTTAPSVSVDDKITSSQWNQLANAFNDRFLGGVGDPTYRLHWYIHSLFRGLRLNNGFEFAAEDEWWKFYSHVEPLTSDYPIVAAGLPEGINKNNPIGNFVFGNEFNNTESEPTRISYNPVDGTGVPLHDGLGAPVSDLDHWDMGIAQRGVTDADGTDLDQANALVSAQHHLKLRGYGFLHKSYGGFLPSPTINGLCGGEDVDGRLDASLKFTVLSDQSVCEYSTCGGGSGSGSCAGVSKSVLTWGQSTTDYLLLHDDGTITKLPFEDYLEGPYTDDEHEAWLNRFDGDQLSRAVNFYSNDFRGSAANRAQDDYNVSNYAFEFQTFLERQYYLAPSYGEDSVYADGTHDAIYPRFEWAVNSGSGWGIKQDTTDDFHDIHTNFVCCAFIAVGNNLIESKTFTLEIDNVIYGSVTIDGTTEDKSIWFPVPAKGRVRVRCDRAFSGTEEAFCEIAELLEMKPQNEDVYLVLRMGSANATGDDGDGQDTSTPRDISDDYFRHGMIYNGTRSAARDEDTEINRNPVYENMRRVCHDRLRLVDRIEIKGYEVAGGKSVFYFDKLARGESDAPMWAGIAPDESSVPSGELKHNVTYKVTGTTGIQYNGAAVATGSTFIGVKGVYDFTKDNGDEVVTQYDGIIADAGEQSTDNNWSMFMSTAGYKPAHGATYKADAYADIIGWGHDRCAMFSKAWTDDLVFSEAKEVLRHVTPVGTSILQRSENPSGYRYLLGSHTPTKAYFPTGNLVEQQNNANCVTTEAEADCGGAVGHYTSCQVYVPDYKIESVVIDGAYVKVTLEGRLRKNDATAPASVTNSSAGWDTYLGTETGPRSDENAIVEYLRYFQGSGGQCVQRIGDFAPDHVVTSGWTGTVINGSCMPRFYFTRQIPKVYEDANNTLETQDTRVVTDEMLWLDLVLKAVCEGYIDETASNDNRKIYTDPVTLLPRCFFKRLFDYTYENLLLQANGNRWQRVVPSSRRDDNPKMFGPFPDVITYAEHFNQISNAVNKLTRARLYLPIQVKYRNVDYEGFAPTNVESNNPVNCFSGSVWAHDRNAPDAVTLRTDISPNPGAWNYEDGSSGDIILLATQKSYIREISGQCYLYTKRNDVEYQFELTDLADFSLPPDLYTLAITDNGIGFLATMDVVTDTHTQVFTVPGDGHTGNGVEADYEYNGTPQRWDPVGTRVTTCLIVDSGTLIAPHPATSDYVDPIDGTASALGSDTERILLVEEIEAFVRVPLV